MDGAELRRLREGRGLTQAQVADYVGCSQGSLSLWENGHWSIPTNPRPASEDLEGAGEEESILDMLEELLAMADDELADAVAVVPAPRGAYKASARGRASGRR